MTVSLRPIVTAAILGLSLVACGGGGAKTGGSPAPGKDAALISVEESLEPGDVVSSAPAEGEPVGPRAPGEAAEVSAARAVPELEVLDPCTLVTGAEFSHWTGDQQAAEPQPLEQGEACGFIDAADDRRLAIGVIPVRADGHRFVPADAGGQTLDQTIGIDVQRLRWIPRYPIPESNVLVAEADGFDLVLEISARGLDEDAVRAGALTLARAAAARVEEALR